MAGRDSDSDSFTHAHTQSKTGASRRLNDGVKQRIVGALVLAALAVIFLPTLFDREGARYIDVTSQIPAAPDIKPISIAEPRPIEGIEPAPPVNEVFQPDYVEQAGPAPDPEVVSLQPQAPAQPEPLPTKPKPEQLAKVEPEPQSASQPESQPGPKLQLPAEETQLDEQGLPEGWVVQVAAYKEVASADRMRDKLMDAGFRAYTRAVDTPKGRFVRVFVGPKLSRVDAQSEKQKLDKLLKIDTLILRYRA